MQFPSHAFRSRRGSPTAAARRLMPLVVLLVLLTTFVGPAPLARAAGFVVTNTNDSGAGSLRQAIIDANATLGSDTISFNIPTSDPGYNAATIHWTIAPVAPLPAITDQVAIDGSTQPGASCASWPPTLKVELSGASVSPFGAGLAITGAGGSAIRGLLINRYSNTGNGDGTSRAITITDSDNNAVECMFFGTNLAGTATVGPGEDFLFNLENILLQGDSANNRIGTNGDGVNDIGERNLLSGARAIVSVDQANRTIIAGNYIGIDVTGTVALAPGNEVVVLADAGVNRIGTNGDGVADAVERNIILGNQAIFIIGSSNNVIAGNYFNVDATGTVAFPHFQSIFVNGNGNRIGTDGSNDAFNANERNVLAGSNSDAIQVFGSPNTVIAGNYIGTNAAGTAALPNSFGISVVSGSSDTRIGTNGDGVADAVEGNLIGGNLNDGIQIADTETSFTTVAGNYIGTDQTGTLDLGNGGNGITVVERPNPNRISGNLIRFNAGAGVLLVNGASGTTIRANSIDLNGAAGIISPERPVPLIARAVPDADTLRATGVVTGVVAAAYTLDFYTSPSCDASFFGEGRTYLGSQQVTTNADGVAEFDLSFTPEVAVPLGQFVTATSTGPSVPGNTVTSAFSNCASAGPGNDSWPRAYALDSDEPFSQPIDLPGQARWFTLAAPPGTRIAVTLSGPGGGELPAGYDIAVFKDIEQAFTNLTSPADLTRLSAEFAGDGFSNDTLARDALNPARIAPQAYSPQAYSPQAYSPQAYSPQAYSPEQIAYASAQSRSLIGVAAQAGTAPRSFGFNTWNNSGNVYVLVRGQNGAFTPVAPFEVRATLLDGVCAGVQVINGVDAGVTGSYRTVILADLSRVAGSPAAISALQTQLNALAAQEGGIIIDTGSPAYANVQAARTQATNNAGCPFAKTQLAEKITALYRNVTGLQYIVIVGSDDAVPFFRSPDNAPLGPEENYEPPLLDSSPAQAALRLNYILSQDAYGARTSLSLGNDSLPLPAIPVGRLVETAPQISAQLAAYLALPGGVVPTPSSALITSYDFLVDAGNEVQAQLTAGLTPAAGPAPRVESLVSPSSESFLDPNAWNADDLRAQLFGSRHDLVFLAGHFSAAGTLAADFSTTVNASEVLTATTDFSNAIIFSAGCHSGYNLLDSAAVPGITRSQDWASAFAARGATLIGGTGYQYGDTDFLAYSEQIYAEFSRQLRVGEPGEAVAIGDALVAAKLDYLARTPRFEGIDDKSLRIATIYGLPMLKVVMPGTRIPRGADGPSAVLPPVVGAAPGSVLGLRTAERSITVDPLVQRSVTLTSADNPGDTFVATYLSAPDGLAIQPSEPVLPLQRENVGVVGTVLRGVGFRGGSYADTSGVRPLVSAATYDLRGVKINFSPPVFWPLKPWSVNYFEALADPANGTTRLLLTPVQYRTNAPTDQTGTRRVFSSMDFRLFYSDRFAAYPSGSAPALSDGPAIARVTSAITGAGAIGFNVSVTGDPAAGVQGVWVTWTDPTVSTPRWRSLDLTQSASDSTQWSATLSGANPASVRFIVQAVNALGVVTLADNFGADFRPGVDTAAPPSATQQPTSLALISPPASGAYSTQTTLLAQLTSAGAPQSGQTVLLSLGGQSQPATTNASGRASATFTLTSPVGAYQAGASFIGTTTLRAAATSSPFTLTKRDTTLTLTPASANVPVGASSGIVATLRDVGGAPLGLRTLFFTVGPQVVAVATNALGQAPLGALSLPAGSYTVQAAFGGSQVAGVTQSDPNYNPASTTASLTLQGAGTAPQITSAPVTAATQGQPYSYQVVATGSPAPSFSLTTAPAGMTINSATGLISWTPTVLPGSYAVTVAAANGVGAPVVQSFSVQVAAATGVQPVSPVLECVVDRGASWSNPATRYLARFGYNNRNSFQVAILVGSTNRFSPNPQNRGQPGVFLGGRQRFVFEVPFNGSNLVWTLSGRTATASSNPAQRCAP